MNRCSRAGQIFKTREEQISNMFSINWMQGKLFMKSSLNTRPFYSPIFPFTYRSVGPRNQNIYSVYKLWMWTDAKKPKATSGGRYWRELTCCVNSSTLPPPHSEGSCEIDFVESIKRRGISADVLSQVSAGDTVATRRAAARGGGSRPHLLDAGGID